MRDFRAVLAGSEIPEVAGASRGRAESRSDRVFGKDSLQYCLQIPPVHTADSIPLRANASASRNVASMRFVYPRAKSCYYQLMKLERITVNPEVCTGKPCIRGLRFPVSRLLGLLASGEPRESILQAYPYLEPQDIDEALRYAASLAEEETVEFTR